MSRSRAAAVRRLGAWLLGTALAANLVGCRVPAADAAADEDERIYELDYRVTIDPAAGGARVQLELEQPDDFLREMDMSLNDGSISDVEGDGEVSADGDRVVWQPPDRGGELSWFVRISHRRGDDSYDAYINDDWALFRAEDIIPSANTRTLRGARSETRLRFELPQGWSSVTPYFGNDDSFVIDEPDRRFDTPKGWIVLGDLGIRNDRIGNIRTKVAAPVGHDVRRMDILALLRWTLPELLRVLPDFPERLTIVSAGEPMWRGALSAPQSMYLHADRPLISENGTSTLLHEAVHVGAGISAERGADWIIEGLAEYYALEILRRSGSISADRYRAARDELDDWGSDVEPLCRRSSSGKVTARAVTILAELNGEIMKATGRKASLDDVLRRTASLDEKITVERFRDIVTRIAGEPMDALDEDNLPGCD
jgi:hypothetical protein